MGTECESALLTKEYLKELLKGKYGDVAVSDFTCKRATAAGDNYGSTLLSLDITILRNNSSEVLQVIAKLLPPTEFLCEVFNVDVTFCKEINFYKLVNPAFIELQKESGFKESDIIHLVPSFYGGCASFNKSGCKNEAVLLLENLKVKKYESADRLKGLDLKHCELALKNLAYFHALCVGLREKKPKLFEETVLKTTVKFQIGPRDQDDIAEIEDFVKTMEKNIPECRIYANKLRECFNFNHKFRNTSFSKALFATFVHNDFWTNNMLFKYNETSHSKTPVDVKLIDFQVSLFSSPAHDILFFLYTSAQTEIIENNYNYLIDFYYENFISLLKQLHCDVKKFTKVAFLKEVDTFAPIELYHILFMIGIVYAEKENVHEQSELISKDQIIEVGCTELCRKKVMTTLNDFAKRDWFRECSDILL